LARRRGGAQGRWAAGVAAGCTITTGGWVSSGRAAGPHRFHRPALPLSSHCPAWTTVRTDCGPPTVFILCRYIAVILPLYCRYIAVILPLYCRCCGGTCAMPVSRRRLDEWRRVSGRPGRLQRRAAGQRRQALCLTGPAPWAAAPTVPRPRPRNPSNTQTLTEALTEITLRVYSLHHLRLCVPRCCLARARRRCAGSAWSPTDVVCVCVVGGLRRAGRRCRCPAQS
jgi:hypothetical protein